MGAAIATLGVTAGSAIGAAVLIAAGVASAVARGFAPYTEFPAVASRAGIVIALALAAGAALVRLRLGAPLRNTARFAAAFSASALLLKLLVLLHPDMPIGDALFQAHRFQEVLGGNLYFTSVAPGNYLFPYAPGLYVFASPFAGLVARGTVGYGAAPDCRRRRRCGRRHRCCTARSPRARATGSPARARWRSTT